MLVHLSYTTVVADHLYRGERVGVVRAGYFYNNYLSSLMA